MTFNNCLIYATLCVSIKILIGKLSDAGDQILPVLAYLLTVISVHKAHLFYSDVIKNFNHMANALAFITCTSSNLASQFALPGISEEGENIVAQVF